MKNSNTAPPSAPVEVEGLRDMANGWLAEAAQAEAEKSFATADARANLAHRLLDALAQQPAAVDEAIAEEMNEQAAIAAYEKYMGVSADDPAYGPDLSQWMAGWNAAIAAQPGGSDNDR